MPHSPDRRWLSWRVAPVPRSRPAGPASVLWGGRLAGHALVPQNDTVTHATPDPLAALKAEAPGPDGVRANLVARVRELIAEGAYDTPERWAEAEDRLIRRLSGDR